MGGQRVAVPACAIYERLPGPPASGTHSKSTQLGARLWESRMWLCQTVRQRHQAPAPFPSSTQGYRIVGVKVLNQHVAGSEGSECTQQARPSPP
eukprot:1159834-Pelagomonas_calceolata.AAC.4